MADLRTPLHRHKAVRAALWLVVLLLVAGSIALIATRAGVDKTLVKQQLDQFAADLKQRGRDTGRVMELTYGDIEMVGGLTDRHALVHDPRFLIKPLPEKAPPPVPGKANSVLITTPVLEIYPESSDLSSLKLVLPQPITVASEEEPKKSLLTITPNAPWALNVAQTKLHGTYYLQLKQSMPDQTRLTYLREQVAQGEEDKTPTVVPVYETLILSLQEGESEVSYALDGSGLGKGTLEFENVSIAPDKMPETAIRIGKMTGRWESERDAKQLHKSSSAFSIDSITAPAEIIPYAPISFAYEMNYQGALPILAGGMPAAQPGPSTLQLKTLSLHTKDATFDATADFTSMADEIMPVGSAHLKFTNVPFIVGELKARHILGADGEVVMQTMIEHISGQAYAAVKDLDFEIKRAKGGTSQIGHASFEELFSLFLKNKLQQLQPQDAAPAKPAAPVAPAAAAAKPPTPKPVPNGSK